MPPISGRTFYTRLTILLTIALGVYLAGNWKFALFDRDESGYALIAREMIHSGDWVLAKILGQPFTGKPIFAFWCQALAMTVFGDSEFSARLPSVVAAVLLLGILGITIGRAIGYRRALWTVTILGTAGLMVALAKMCLVDSILLLWIATSQLCLYAIYRGRGGWWVVGLFWVFVGLAMLTKGPPILGVLGGTLISLAIMDVGSDWRSPAAWWNAVKWWLRAHPWFGILIVALINGPWLIMVNQRDPGFVHEMWTMYFIGPIAVAAQNGHGYPPGYFLLIIWLTFMPWSLYLVLAMFGGWTNRRLPPIRFAMAAVIGPWIVIELVRQKLPHYMLPLFPPLAFLTADALVRCMRGENKSLTWRSAKIGTGIWAFGVLIAACLPSLPAWPSFGFKNLPILPMVAMIALGLAFGPIVMLLLHKKKPTMAMAAIAIGMCLAVINLFGFILPNDDFLRIAFDAAGVLKAHGATRAGDSIMVGDADKGFHEPSLGYYAKGILDPQDANYLVEKPLSELPQWIVTTVAMTRNLPQDKRKHLKVVATLHGLDVGGTQGIVDVVVMEKVD